MMIVPKMRTGLGGDMDIRIDEVAPRLHSESCIGPDYVDSIDEEEA